MSCLCGAMSCCSPSGREWLVGPRRMGAPVWVCPVGRRGDVCGSRWGTSPTACHHGDTVATRLCGLVWPRRPRRSIVAGIVPAARDARKSPPGRPNTEQMSDATSRRLTAGIGTRCRRGLADVIPPKIARNLRFARGGTTGVHQAGTPDGEAAVKRGWPLPEAPPSRRPTTTRARRMPALPASARIPDDSEGPRPGRARAALRGPRARPRIQHRPRRSLLIS